ncbi:hypothetical protein GT045_29235 [Streptomyces sp. SID486]|uniref:hypothetical protein n=1 Tax=Streptomyces sp. SID486 TaxID=2690264 RepID=UPI00136E8063|nr:hypothetical protein [Streptomyces sp. SID486]MYX98776.1 hypothetical protein [Streptomyces sp. SID486]
MRKIAAVGVAMVALSGSLGFMATEAVAAPQQASVSDAVGWGAAPGCVDVKKTHQDEGYKAFKVKNNCSSTKRLKGVFKYGYDSPCTPVKPGKSALLTSMQPWVDYDKVVTC